MDINIDYDDVNKFDESKKLDMKILSLFQEMDSLGNYTNTSWFNSLDKYQLIQLFRELMDIWDYRANLSQEVKREIIPPTGNPFGSQNSNYININNISSFSFIHIKKCLVNIFDQFINRGINIESKKLGCFYVLSALTLVNYEAAESMPWLYQAVLHN